MNSAEGDIVVLRAVRSNCRISLLRDLKSKGGDFLQERGTEVCHFTEVYI